MRLKLTIARALALLLVSAILLASGSYLQAQDADALVRVQDRQHRTKVERERVLTETLNAAREASDAADWTRAAGFLNRAGRLLQLGLHEPETALDRFQEVRGMLQHSTESRDYIDSLNGSAAAYNDLSKCDEAGSLTTDALERSRRINYIAGEAEALGRGTPPP